MIDINKLKIGDKIKCIDANPYTTSVTIGKVYEVAKIVNNAPRILDDDNDYDRLLPIFCLERHTLFDYVDDEPKLMYGDISYEDYFDQEMIRFRTEALESMIKNRDCEIVKKLLELDYNEKMNEEVNKMDEIKNYKKKNLKEAKKQAISERNDYETQKAKTMYESLIDRKDQVDRSMIELNKTLDEINKELIEFD